MEKVEKIWQNLWKKKKKKVDNDGEEMEDKENVNPRRENDPIEKINVPQIATSVTGTFNISIKIASLVSLSIRNCSGR